MNANDSTLDSKEKSPGISAYQLKDLKIRSDDRVIITSPKTSPRASHQQFRIKKTVVIAGVNHHEAKKGI